MSSIGEGCDSLGKTSLTSLFGILLGYRQTPVELVPSEGRAYNLSFVPARGECNINYDS